MTTRSLPAFLLKTIPDITTASAQYLSTYTRFMLDTVEAKDGPIADAHIQLLALNQRLRKEIARTGKNSEESYVGILSPIVGIREMLVSARGGVPADGPMSDDIGRLICATDAMAEVGSRAARYAEWRSRAVVNTEDAEAA